MASRIGYLFRTNDRDWSNTYGEDDVQSQFTTRLSNMDGPFHQRQQGEKAFGPYKPKLDASHAATHDLLAGDVGLVLAVLNKANLGVRARKMEYQLRVAATTGNELVDLLFGDVLSLYNPGVRNMGAMVDKNIGTTSTISQHHCFTALSGADAKAFSTPAKSAGGNAIDVGHSNPKKMDEMFFGYIHVHDDFALQNVIHWPTTSHIPLIWNPESGIHPYSIPKGGSDHKGHVHFDFQPSRPTGSSHPC